jgi:hypothetical protein
LPQDGLEQFREFIGDGGQRDDIGSTRSEKAAGSAQVFGRQKDDGSEAVAGDEAL